MCLELFSSPLTVCHIFHICIFYGQCLKVFIMHSLLLFKFYWKRMIAKYEDDLFLFMGVMFSSGRLNSFLVSLNLSPSN